MLGAVEVDLETAQAVMSDPATTVLEPERSAAARPSTRAIRRSAGLLGAEALPQVESSPSGSTTAVLDFLPATPLSLAQLGLAGRNMFLGASSENGAGGPAARTERNEAPGVDVSMRDALLEHDHGAGLDRSGAVIGVAEDVARQNDAPLDSRALVELTIDTNGRVTNAHLLDASTGHDAWERIAASLVSSLHARQSILRRGLATIVTLEITSKWQLPSGDSPGGAVHSNPGGFSFDVADIGARPLRVVHARILREKMQR
ncbi:MAG: hypothetical protein M3O50_15915 [Myxococcota bacterium]|nr:hypothetical protein [Myxococcota bacterium]